MSDRKVITMTEVRKYLGVALAACVVAILALLFMPFVGFTEAFDFGGGTTYRDIEATGLGTYGEDLALFEYPEYLVYPQILMVLLALVLAFVARELLRAYRAGTPPDTGAARVARLLCLLVAGAVVAATLLTGFGILAATEEETIWNTEFRGSISDWWVQYGAGVALVGAGVAAWGISRSTRAQVSEPSA